MDALPQDKQGLASAINDLARELGGVLGIAILGSVLNVGYRSGLAAAASSLSEAELAQAQQSLPSALLVAEQLGGGQGDWLAALAREAFVGGLSASLVAGVVVLILGTVGVLLLVSEGSARELGHRQAGEQA